MTEHHYSCYILRSSQNHRVVGVGRDLWGSSSPTPLPKQVSPEQAAQNHVQAGFEDLQRKQLHNLSRQAVPVLHHPQSKFLLMFRRNFLRFSLCPLPTLFFYLKFLLLNLHDFSSLNLPNHLLNSSYSSNYSSFFIPL